MGLNKLLYKNEIKFSKYCDPRVTGNILNSTFSGTDKLDNELIYLKRNVEFRNMKAKECGAVDNIVYCYLFGEMRVNENDFQEYSCVVRTNFSNGKIIQINFLRIPS